MKEYIEVCNTGNYSIISIGNHYDIENCYNAWEEIVRRNSETTNNLQYFTYKSLLTTYAKLIGELVIVKACLMKLCFMVDDDTINDLKRYGYVINTSGKSAYENSLSTSFRRSDNLFTKITMKQNEINRLNEDKADHVASFEELIAGISAELGFNIESDITLARYNEYKKIIRKKHGRNKRPGFNK